MISRVRGPKIHQASSEPKRALPIPAQVAEMPYLNLPYDACVIGMAVVTCIYVVLGGYMATVMNDFIQGIVIDTGPGGRDAVLEAELARVAHEHHSREVAGTVGEGAHRRAHVAAAQNESPRLPALWLASTWPSSPRARSPHNLSSDTNSTRVFARGYFFVAGGEKSCAPCEGIPLRFLAWN